MPPDPDRYRVLRTLGRGRHATVLAAFDTRLGRTVALKRAHSANDEPTLRAEAQRLARVRSPHVVGVHDVLDAVPLTLVLEWVEGATLRDRIHAGRPALPDVVAWMRDLFAGLAALHAAGITHGDIKPENVWIDTQGRLVLLDVGTGVDATPLYAAPEVASGGDPKPSSDLYAAATVAWELLAGRLPFDAVEAAELAARKRTRAAPALASAGVTVAPAIEAWFERALTAEPAQRHATAVEAARAWCAATAGTSDRETTVGACELHPDAKGALDALAAPERGRHGRLIRLTGLPGSGKTHVLRATTQSARDRGVRVLEIRHAPAARRRRYVDWHLAVRRALRTHPDLPARTLLVPAGSLAETAIQDRIVRALSGVASGNPVLIACDDPATCDSATRRLVLHLAEHAASGGWSVVVASDSVRPGRSAARLESALATLAHDHVEIGPPDETGWRAFVARRLGVGSASDALLAHLRARTGANPGLTLAELRALHAAGALQRAGDAWVFRPEKAPASLPASAASILERGMSGLAATDRELLQVAALHGARFDAVTLAAVTCAAPAAVEQALHTIERERGVVRRDGTHWNFVPPLAAQALAAHLAPAVRIGVHRRFAAALLQRSPADDGAVGRHLDESGDADAALPFLERAARAALEAGDAAAAAEAATRACRITSAATDSESAVSRRVELGLLRAQALHALAAWDEARPELETCLTLARAWGLEVLEMRALRAQGRIEYACNQYDDAIARYLTAQECASRLGDGTELHELALQIGNIHFERGRLDDAAGEYERTLTWAEEHAELDLAARAANNVALVESLQGRKQRAVQFFTRSRERFVALGRDSAVARTEQNIGQIYLELRNWAEARNFFRRAMETSERTREDALLAVACLDFAEATLQLGAAAEAAPAVERALAISRERGDAVGVANAQRLQGLLAAAAGDTDHAETLLADAIQQLERLGEALHLALSWKDLGAVRVQAGRFKAALHALDEARHRFASLDAPQHAAEVEALRARCGEESPCQP